MSDVESGAESDSSIGTQELNDLQASITQSFKSDDESSKPEEPVVKKPRKRKVLKKAELIQPHQEYNEEPTTKAVKKRGRPPKPIEEKLAKQVIRKEKIVYVVQDNDGNLVRKDPTKLGIRELRKLKIEDDAQKAEIEYGKKLGRLKNGKAKIPKTRTEAQRKATERMLEFNRLKRAGKKSEDKIERKAEIKEVVKESVKEVVQEPAIPKPPPQKSIEQQYFDFFS